MRSSEDLPEPLRPTSASLSPGETLSVAPRSSGMVPKLALMSVSRSSGGAAISGLCGGGGHTSTL
jgi:hypothetical protein